MKIIHKLILGFLAVIFLIWVVGYVAVTKSQNTLQKSIGEYSVLLTQEILDEIDKGIYNIIEGLQIYSRNSILQKAIVKSNQEFAELDNIQEYIDEKDKEWISAPKRELTPFMQDKISNVLAKKLKERKEFYKEKYGFAVLGEIYVTNKYGVIISSTGRTSDYLQADEEWYREAVKEKNFWAGNFEYDESSDMFAIDIVINLYDDIGNFAGILKGVLNIEESINIMRAVSAQSVYGSTEFKLLNREGKIIYSSEEEIDKALERPYELFLHFKQDEGHISYFVGKGDKPGEGKELFTHAHSNGYREYKGLGWILVMEYEIKEIFAPATKLRNSILVISVVVTLLAIVMSFSIFNSISKPLTKLRAATIEIGRGNLDVCINVESKDEVGQLATFLKKMTDDLRNTTVSRDSLAKEIAERKKSEEERIKLEKELQQAQKLKSIGTLAAGIAHEINTPIQFINDNTLFLSEGINNLIVLINTYKNLLNECGLSEKATNAIKKGQEADLEYFKKEIPKAITQTQEGLDHVTKIVNAMKSFSHMDTEEKTVADINKAIESTVTVSRNEWKYVADVKTDLAPGLPLVSCFLGDINQAVMNLIVNAAHAISDAVGDKGKGLITINTRRNSDNVVITVADTGTGIPEDIQDKVFDHFFTTKYVGKGTGQGLSMAYATVVEKHGGKLTFETEMGKGTTFVIELPISGKEKVNKL